LKQKRKKLQNEINQTKKLKKEEADKKSESIDEKLRQLVEKTSKLFG
jgi:hypothetical protein